MRSKRLVAAVCLAAAFGIGLAAQGGAEKAQMDSDAAMSSGGGAALSRWLADDLTFVGGAGRLRDKKTVVSEIQPSTGTPGKNLDVIARPYPGGSVMVFTRQNADGSQARVLRLWVQRGESVAARGAPRRGDWQTCRRSLRNPRLRCRPTQDQRRTSKPSNRRLPRSRRGTARGMRRTSQPP